MRPARTFAWLIPIACAAMLLAGSGSAQAQFTATADCTGGNTTALQTLLNVNTWQGGSVDVKGPCLGDVTVVAPTALIGDASVGGTVDGQIEVYGARLACSNLTLQGSQNISESALWVHQSAVATLQNCSISQANLDGVYVEKQSALYMFAGSIQNTGCGTNASPNNNAIEASDGATVTLGNAPNDLGSNVIEGDNVVTIYNNCGDGLHVTGGSTVHAFAPTIYDNAGNAIYVSEGSNARIDSAVIIGASNGTAPWAMQVLAGSSLYLHFVNPLLAFQHDTSSPNGGILVARNSTLYMGDTTLQQENASGAVVEASYNSSVVVAGGNSLSAASGGTAIQIDHSSSFAQVPIAFAEPDAITGAGLIQEQSSVDIGQGVISSQLSITWTGSVSVQQSSSFRLSGGVHITGAVTLQQGSNGFFNLGNGSTNAVDGGVSCPFTTVPASHVSAPQKVTPNVTMATSLAGATSPQCLPF